MIGRLITLLFTTLESRLGGIIVEVLLWFGLSVGGYTLSVGPLRAFIQGQASGLGGQAVAILGFLGVDKAVTMLLSALAARYAVDGARAILQRRRGAG